MKPQNSSTAFSGLAAIAPLTILLQISGAGPKPALAGQPIRGTPIDSSPETNGPLAPNEPQARPIAANLHVEEYRENRTMLGICRLGGDKLAAPDEP